MLISNPLPRSGKKEEKMFVNASGMNDYCCYYKGWNGTPHQLHGVHWDSVSQCTPAWTWQHKWAVIGKGTLNQDKIQWHLAQHIITSYHNYMSIGTNIYVIYTTYNFLVKTSWRHHILKIQISAKQTICILTYLGVRLQQEVLRTV